MKRPPPLLLLRRVSRDFREGTVVTSALRRVDLTVGQGDFLAITGPSGAGKSTLLNVVGMLDAPSAGAYKLAGRSVAELSPAERDHIRSRVFGFVFQSSHLLPFETVAHNAALGLAVRGVPRGEREQLVTAALRQVGLLHRAQATARTLSGGERQRLAIARAIATKPLVVLADEPTGNLDSDNGAQIMAIFRELNAGGTTIIVITHDSAVADSASRQVRVADGVLREVAHKSSAMNASAIQFVLEPRAQRIGATLGAGLERLSEALSGLTSRPMRTVALLCAFMLGAGGLVAATGLGASASQQVESRLTASALDELYVFVPPELSKTERAAWKSAIASLSRVEGVAERIDIPAQDAKVSLLPTDSALGQPTFTGRTIAVDDAYVQLVGARLEDHSVLRATLDANTAILGETAASELGIGSLGEGRMIWALGRSFEVVNIVADAGRDPLLASSVILSTEASPGSSATLVVRTEAGFPAAVADAVPVLLAPGSPGSIHVNTVADLRKLRVGVAGDLNTLVAVVSLVLLLMAVLSAGTSMFLSVQSRVQEIALRRALGLSRAQTALLFLVEGAVVGLAGGVAGVAVGLVVVVGVAFAQGWSAVLPLSVVPIGVSAGLIGGILSAVLPALAATRVEPAQAIR